MPVPVNASRNREAEILVLGACILTGNADPLGDLDPREFSFEQHSVVARAICEIQSDITLSRIAEKVEGRLRQSDLAGLLDGVPLLDGERLARERERIRKAHREHQIRKSVTALGNAAASGQSIGTLTAKFRTITTELSAVESGKASSLSPWARAETMEAFLAGVEDRVDFLDLDKRIIARQSITELFAPRGVGKSLFALWLAVQCARRGLRVLLIDRDNPRSVVKKRLLSFGVDHEISTLKAITREKCPPLTNSAAWAVFPYEDYDVVIVDPLDSAAEGVGEQDSAKPSRAVAPLLDIARRESGPSVLVLGNCVRRGTHSRGSGVIEDRADMVYEVRDATDFHPSGKKPWPEELPPADAGSWASRSSRRKQRQTYRLAFIATKFRIAEEPEPFILEIDTRLEPWTVRDVTDEVDREGAAERERRAREKAEQTTRATNFLVAEISKRQDAGEPEILNAEAEEFLTQRKTTRQLARVVLASPAFELVSLPGPGHPKAVRLPRKNEEGGRNSAPFKTAEKQGANDADFRQAHEQRAAEIWPHDPQQQSGSDKGCISAEGSLIAPPENDDGEAVL